MRFGGSEAAAITQKTQAGVHIIVVGNREWNSPLGRPRISRIIVNSLNACFGSKV
jgi:hypothetical protein